MDGDLFKAVVTLPSPRKTESGASAAGPRPVLNGMGRGPYFEKLTPDFFAFAASLWYDTIIYA